MEEIWKDIKGFEYKYQISNKGNVKIKENSYYTMNMGEMRKRTQKSKIMKPIENGYGYLKVSLTDENKKVSNNYIHRLVALHFIDNHCNKSQVNHLDGNKKNNNVNNLEWVSPKENIYHLVNELNFKPNTKGIRQPSPVIQIDKSNGEIIAEFDTITQAHNETGISHISSVCRGVRKTAGGYKWKYK